VAVPERPVHGDQSVSPKAVGAREPGIGDECQLVGERNVEVLFRPLCEVRVRLLGGDAVAFHVGVQVFEHAATLRPLRMHQSVSDDDEASRFESGQNSPVQLPLLGVLGDVVESERGDDRVAAGELILEPSTSQRVPTRVRRTPHRSDFEHVRIDVGERLPRREVRRVVADGAQSPEVVDRPLDQWSAGRLAA
jgi:hypothetical protein